MSTSPGHQMSLSSDPTFSATQPRMTWGRQAGIALFGVLASAKPNPKLCQPVTVCDICTLILTTK